MNIRTAVVVTGLSRPAPDVAEVRLSGTGPGVLPNWSPGAHIGLHLPTGTVREYSLVSDPLDCGEWVIAVHREPHSRGGSRFIHDELRVGMTLEVDGPKNHFLLEPARRYFLVAGGIGVTPLIPMAARLDLLGCDWQMLYAGRVEQEMAYAERLRQRHPTRVTVHGDDRAGGRPPVPEFLADVQQSDLVNCCGPEGLMAAVGAAMADASRLRVERFRAPAQENVDRQAFVAVLAHSGARIEVSGSESLLDALCRSGIAIASSCTEGICGTCEVGVLDGEVEHRDFLLTAQERARNNVMMTCVSRARTASLTLDLPVLTESDYER
jgi:ferredoxin-NADP reductase